MRRSRPWLASWTLCRGSCPTRSVRPDRRPTTGTASRIISHHGRPSWAATHEYYERVCPDRTALRENSSVQVRNDLVLHLRRVLIPQRPVLRPADLVVVCLAADEERDVVQRVQPHHPDAEVAGCERDGDRLDDLSEVVDVPAASPEAVDQ